MKHLTHSIVIEADSTVTLSPAGIQGCYSREKHTKKRGKHQGCDRLHVEIVLPDGEKFPNPPTVSLSTVEIARLMPKLPP